MIATAVDTVVFPRLLSSHGIFLRPWWVDASQWFGNFTLTETWRFHVIGNEQKFFYLGHYWTLCFEEQFYAVMGCLLVLFPRYLFRAAGVLTVLVIPLNELCRRNGIGTQGLFFDEQWHLFAMGILVYAAIVCGNDVSRCVSALFLACVAASTLLDVPRLLEPEKNFSQNLFVASLFSLVLLGFHRWDGQIASRRWLWPLMLCGQMCYSLYLVHLPVIRFVRAGLLQAGYAPELLHPGTTIAICLATSFVVAWPFHVLVERRFLNPRHQWTSGTAAVPQMSLRA